MKSVLKILGILVCVCATANGQAKETPAVTQKTTEVKNHQERRLTWAQGPRAKIGVAWFTTEFFFDGVSTSLEAVYEKLRNEKITKLTIVCSNPKFPNYDPIGDSRIIENLYPLLREKQITLVLEFENSKEDILRAHYSNPFSPTANHQDTEIKKDK